MSKEITYEEAQELVKTTKENLKMAKAELRDFRKENNIKKDDVPEDEKLAKKLGKLVSKVEALEAELAEADELAKGLKPKRSGGFAKKYEYPEGMTDDKEKKKYRAKMRRQNNKAEKAEGDPTAEAPAEKPAKKERKTPEVAED